MMLRGGSRAFGWACQKPDLGWPPSTQVAFLRVAGQVPGRLGGESIIGRSASSTSSESTGYPRRLRRGKNFGSSPGPMSEQ